MTRWTWVLVSALVLARASGAGAQEQLVPLVDAGRAATVIVQVPAPRGADSARYTLSLDPTYRSFVPEQARIGRIGDRFVVPITFATPDHLPAGRVTAGTLELDIEGFEISRRELVIEIKERRAVTFELDADELTIAPDGVTGIPFHAHNQGNQPDTVILEIRAADGWTLMNAPRLVLAAGDSAYGAVRIAAPVTVTPGDRELVLVTARTTAQELSRTVNLVVVSPAGWLGNLAHVPSSVFVGHALGDGTGPVIALNGGGHIGSDTEVQLDLRHAEGVLDPALQRKVAGARLRAAVTRPGLRVEAGDVYGFQSTLSGSLRRARGLESEYSPDGPLSLRAVAAVPVGFSGQVNGGHIFYGEAGYETPIGEATLLVGDMLHPALGTLAETRASGAGVRWSRSAGTHKGSVEATFVRFTAGDSIHRTGPALDMEYGLDGQRVNGRIRFRRVPDAATNPGGRGNEISGSLTGRISPALYLVAWGFDVEQNLLGSASSSASRAGNVGFRARLGRLQMQVGGRLSERSVTSAGNAFDSYRRTVRAEGIYSRGSIALQTDIEAGTSMDFDREGAYRAVGSSLRLYGSDRWGWIRIQHTRRPGGVQTTSANLGGTAAIGPVEFSGGVTRTQSGDIVSTSFWSGTEIQALRNTAIHLGASARPSLGAPDWTFSLGVSRRLNLPLPLARQPDLRGTIFDDANYNGIPDPGEAPIPGVVLTLGYLETTTAADGRFSFRDATGASLQVRTEQLPIGYVVSPGVSLPTRGEVAIPLVRTATLTLDLFLDRDEDGQRDPAETVGAGVSVTVTDEQGRRRTVTADVDGRARISGLLPGSYAVTARPPSQGRAGANPEVLMEVDLGPGEEQMSTLAVPLRRRTIRMGGAAGGFQFFDRN